MAIGTVAAVAPDSSVGRAARRLGEATEPRRPLRGRRARPASSIGSRVGVPIPTCPTTSSPTASDPASDPSSDGSMFHTCTSWSTSTSRSSTGRSRPTWTPCVSSTRSCRSAGSRAWSRTCITAWAAVTADRRRVRSRSRNRPRSPNCSTPLTKPAPTIPPPRYTRCSADSVIASRPMSETRVLVHLPADVRALMTGPRRRRIGGPAPHGSATRCGGRGRRRCRAGPGRSHHARSGDNPARTRSRRGARRHRGATPRVTRTVGFDTRHVAIWPSACALRDERSARPNSGRRCNPCRRPTARGSG